ncbi:hypothetical protein [Bacteroides faecalis]|nr:hypothetical protein [Bacteroides faecalis]
MEKSTALLLAILFRLNGYAQRGGLQYELITLLEEVETNMYC